MAGNEEFGPEQPREVMLYQNGTDALGGSSPERPNLVLLESLDAGQSRPKAEDHGLVSLWSLVRDHRWMLAVCVLLGGTAAALLTSLQVPEYRAQAKVEILPPIESPFGFQSVPTGADGAPETYINTQVKILESRSLRLRVLDHLTSAGKLSSFTPVDRWSKMKSLLGQGASPPQAPSFSVPVFTYKVNHDTTRVVDLICESEDPRFATDYVNVVAEEYAKFQIESRWNNARQTMVWLGEQLEDMKTKLEDSESKLQSYSRSVGLLMVDGAADNVAQEKLKQTQAELSRASSDRVEKQSVYEIASSSPADTVPEVIDNPRLSGYKTKLAELRQQEAELRTIYTQEHPRVVRVKAEIAELQKTFQEERDAVIARIRNSYLASVNREKLLAAAYRSQAKVVADIADKSGIYGVLKREVDTNQQLYGALLQKVKESSVASAMGASSVQVVDPAMVPGAPFSPNLQMNLAEGLASGLLFGIVLVLGIDRLNGSLRAPGEAETVLRVPELGVIPARDSRLVRRLGRLKNEGINGYESRLGNQTIDLAAWGADSVLAESFRNLRTSILLCKNGELRPRVILVTSVERQDGKSSTVSNLGIALAHIGQRVVLIDGDMRRPRLHTIFDTPNSWGLSDLLREKIPLNDIPAEAMARKTGIGRLFLLPSGPAGLGLSDLLYSDRMGEVIARLREMFDTIIIDTPPMGYLSDARVVGRMADAAILVIRSGQTSKKSALRAKQRLTEDGIHVLGIVLNRWEPQSKSEYDSYYSYHEDDT